MITLTMLLILVSMCSIQYESLFDLILLIILLSMTVAGLLFKTNNILLALMWLLVYLGGMMVCFIYVLFMAYSANSDANIVALEKRLTLPQFMLTSMQLVFIIKMLFLPFYLSHSSFPTMWVIDKFVFSDGYLHLVGYPHIYFLATMLLLFSLIQVLAMINMKSKFSSLSLL